MKKHTSNWSFLKDEERVSQVFLGIGLSLFLLNISSFLSYLPEKYSYLNFDLSVFSSILIIVYSVYIIHKNKK